MVILRAGMLSLLAPLLPAQLLVVDPLGGGTHTDLQAAITAAPAGAVVHVRGGAWGPLVLTRSITIVGQGQPTVHAPFSGLGQQPAAITLQGSGVDTAVLAGLDVRGDANGVWWNHAGPGIASSGFAHVAVHDCTVRGHDWAMITGTATGASGIVFGGTGTLHVVRSIVGASRGYPGSNNTWAPNGAPAISAAAARVVLLDATIAGGDVAAMVWTMGAPWTNPCPCGTPGLEPGRGGAGVVAQAVFLAGGTITGGDGAAVFSGSPPVPFGDQPDGTPIVAPAQLTVPRTLTASPLRLGTTHTVAFPPTTVPALFAIGAPTRWPVPVLPATFSFVDPLQPFVLHFLPPASSTFALAVPANPLLLGHLLAEQRFDLPPTGLVIASDPVLAVVLP
jgi:hypothetical protein